MRDEDSAAATALALIEKFRAAGVDLGGGRVSAYDLLEPGNVRFGADGLAEPRPGPPVVSCLMVTRGNPDLLRFSAECYAHQTWAERELVVVTQTDQAAIEAVLASLNIKNSSVTRASPELTLGDLRNMAVARARGEILMQWDDDDLCDPERIRSAVSLLQETTAGAAFLSRLMIWWPQRRLFALSALRLWEGSIAVRKAQSRPFPALGRGEDNVAARALAQSCPIALLHAPLLYVYIVNGQNTWNTEHFNTLIEDAAARFENEEYDQLKALLNRRMPILGYESYLGRAR
jgi:hypothetical protein